jgi:hypothetical protein
MSLKSPLFWVGAVLFLAAITTSVLSDGLAWRPSLHGYAGSTRSE